MNTNTPLDSMINGIEDDAITNIYGPAGSGKTNIAISTLLGALKNGGKVIYIDTENSFSFERFKQMGGSEELLGNILFPKVYDWESQNKIISELESNLDGISLIIIDSMVALYRLNLDDSNYKIINKNLMQQYSKLSNLSKEKKIPILVTSQIYSKDDKTEITSNNISKYWSNVLIEIEKDVENNQRIAILKKHRSEPEGKSIKFEIVQNGMQEIQGL